MFKQKDEEKVVTAQEEVKQEQKKAKELNPFDIDFSSCVDYDDPKFQMLEDKRLEFNKRYKKIGIFKWISAGLAIALLIFSWIFIMGQLKITWLGFVLTGVSIAMILAYYLISKKITSGWLNDYMKVFYSISNSFVYGYEDFSDVRGDIKGTVSNNEFTESKLYTGVTQFGSRNVVNFKIHKKYNATICDCAAQTSTIKQLQPLFIGKFLEIDNNYDGNDPIIIYLTGNERSLRPNNVDAIPKKMNTKKMIIYTNNEKYESYLNYRARTLISKIVTNNILVDCSISITKGKTYFCLGYDDCLMVLPVEAKFNPLAVKRFREDLILISLLTLCLNEPNTELPSFEEFIKSYEDKLKNNVINSKKPDVTDEIAATLEAPTKDSSKAVEEPKVTVEEPNKEEK